MSTERNPYAPPAVEEALARDPIEILKTNFNPAAEPFISPATRGSVATFFMALAILANLGIVGVMMLTQTLLDQMAGGYQPTQAEIDLDTMRLNAASAVLIGVRLIAVLAFMFWTYRVVSNLRALGTERPENTPGWAVGYYFVPILNLFRPYQALLEAWNASNPQRLNTHQSHSDGVALVGWWWGVHICTVIVGRIAEGMGRHQNQDIESLISHNYLIIALILCLEIPRDILSILVIRGLNRNQLERRELVVAGTPPAAKSVVISDPFAN